jgi:hypothetical protein
MFKRWQPRYFEIGGHYLKYAKDEKSLSNHPGNAKASFDLTQRIKQAGTLELEQRLD